MRQFYRSADRRCVDLVETPLSFGGYGIRIANAAVGYARFFSRSHDAVIRVFDVAGNVIEIHKYTGDFKDP